MASRKPYARRRPFTFVDVKGRGHIAGVTLQAQGLEPGGTPFFEGDDQATLDGTLAAHGTGSEDFFNGGWYDVPGRWESRVSFPWSGCLDYQKHLGRTGAYRYFLTDAYAFRESAKLTIEHGPEGNRIPTDYVGVTYLYAVARPENLPLLPPLAARRVDDPRKVVFAAGWNIPVQAFSFRNATLAKKETKLGQERVRYLSMTASGDDVFGAHFLSLAADLPAAGRYRVSIEAVKGPAGATVQLFRNEQAIGPAADLRASELRKSGPIPVGELELAEGPNPLFFKLTGKDPQFDLIRIVCERLTP